MPFQRLPKRRMTNYGWGDQPLMLETRLVLGSWYKQQTNPRQHSNYNLELLRR